MQALPVVLVQSGKVTKRSWGINVRPVQSHFAVTEDALTGTLDSILPFACIFLADFLGPFRISDVTKYKPSRVSRWCKTQ